MTSYLSAAELVVQARRGAEHALARPTGVRRASTVYVTEQTQRMYEGRGDRFRYLVTTSAPQRWLVRDGELRVVERILMSAPWAAATSVDALVECLLSSISTGTHPQAAQGQGGCGFVAGLDTLCSTNVSQTQRKRTTAPSARSSCRSSRGHDASTSSAERP